MFWVSDIWILREMFDKFVLNCGTSTKEREQKNMILGNAIINRLKALNSISYAKDIKSIYGEVVSAYKKAYGTKTPELEYTQLMQDYIEK